MSGITGDNPYRASGIIAAAAAGGVTWQDVVTASTLTAVAGNAYPINTTSNTCTITLPASASNGDEIIFTDYARNWGTNKIIIDSNGLNYQGDDDSYDVEYDTDGQSVQIVYSDATKGWIPISDDDVADAPSKGNDNGLFAFGQSAAPPPYYNVSNKVSNTGVVATDTAGVGTARGEGVAGCEYGGDKGIIGFGVLPSLAQTALTNLVSNTGVVATDTAGVGTARAGLGGCSYGGDKGIFSNTATNYTNLVSNTGVVATDVAGVGTAKGATAGCEYGQDKGIFGFGQVSGPAVTAITNLVSNTGVVGTDVSGVGTTRKYLASCSYN